MLEELVGSYRSLMNLGLPVGRFNPYVQPSGGPQGHFEASSLSHYTATADKYHDFPALPMCWTLGCISGMWMPSMRSRGECAPRRAPGWRHIIPKVCLPREPWWGDELPLHHPPLSVPRSPPEVLATPNDSSLLPGRGLTSHTSLQVPAHLTLIWVLDLPSLTNEMSGSATTAKRSPNTERCLPLPAQPSRSGRLSHPQPSLLFTPPSKTPHQTIVFANPALLLFVRRSPGFRRAGLWLNSDNAVGNRMIRWAA